MNAGAAPRATTGRAWQTPAGHGATLLDPPLAQLPGLARQAARHASQLSLGDRTLEALRVSARQEVLTAALAYSRDYRDVAAPRSDGPLFVAGHQPELFHPGVWYKSFVLARLSQHGPALNLLIDSDLARRTAIAVPQGAASAPSKAWTAFDADGPETPYEERLILDDALWRSFPHRVARQMGAWGYRPILEEFWPLVLARSAAHRNLGLCLAQARHAWEERWGLHTLELPFGRVCQTEAFAWFAAWLLAEADRVRAGYNGAILDYRSQQGLRSKNHPAPLLDCDADGCETPLWVWQAADPRRRRLFVSRRRDALVLGDRALWQAELPVPRAGDFSPLAAALADLARSGVRLRTRALATTWFVRLVAGDLFIHGIGGAKYDRATDDLCRRLLGQAPPTYAVASATLELPLGGPSVPPDEEAALRRQLRELTYHGERFLAPDANLPPAVARAVREKHSRLAERPPVRAGKVRRAAIVAANAVLAEHLSAVRQELASRLRQCAETQRKAAVLRWREYAFCLHPSESLRHFLLEIPARQS